MRLQISRPGNLTSGYKSFMHIHDKRKRPRDNYRFFDQREVNFAHKHRCVLNCLKILCSPNSHHFHFFCYHIKIFYLPKFPSRMLFVLFTGFPISQQNFKKLNLSVKTLRNNMSKMSLNV